MTIQSKFDPINAIIAPIILVIVLGGIGCGIGYTSFLDVSNGKTDSIFKTPIYGSALMFASMIGIVIHYLRMIKKIQIDNQGIKFTNLFQSEFIRWIDVKKIEMTGKSQNMNTPAETTNLILNTGKRIEILAPFYKNISLIRIALEQILESLSKEDPIELKPIKEAPKVKFHGFVNYRDMNKYSGNHFLSFNGILIYGMIAFSIYFLLTFGSTRNLGYLLVAFSVSNGFFYSFLGYQLHYFYLDKNYLVIKNHVWPWVNHVYKIEDIKEIVFELPQKRSLSLRIITKGYYSKLYPAGSLSDKTWKALKEEFIGLKVNIRNEINL